MKHARYSLFKIIILILVVSISYSFSSPFFINDTYAYSQGDLEINWGVPSGDPIFAVDDFKPCDVEKRKVRVKNNDHDPKKIGVKGIKTAETGDISGVIDFKITDGTGDIYGGTTGAKTLEDFFNDSANPGGIDLATLNKNKSKNFYFAATFNCDAGNEFQQKKVVFDILLGVLTKNDCDEDDEDDDDDDHHGDNHHGYRLIYETENDYRNRDRDERCEEEDDDHHGGGNHGGEHGNDNRDWWQNWGSFANTFSSWSRPGLSFFGR